MFANWIQTVFVFQPFFLIFELPPVNLCSKVKYSYFGSTFHFTVIIALPHNCNTIYVVYMEKHDFGKSWSLHVFKIPRTSFVTTYFIFQQFVMGTTTGGKTSCDIASRIQLTAHNWRNKLSLKHISNHKFAWAQHVIRAKMTK